MSNHGWVIFHSRVNEFGTASVDVYKRINLTVMFL